MSNQKHFHLYVLKLEQNKYYIGITAKTPEERFREHKNGFMASRYTKKYKPLKLIDSRDLGLKTLEEAEAYENKVVRKYMKEKGYNNARGGDVTDEGDYILRFGRLFDSESHESIATVLLLLLIIIAMIIAYELK